MTNINKQGYDSQSNYFENMRKDRMEKGKLDPLHDKSNSDFDKCGETIKLHNDFDKCVETIDKALCSLEEGVNELKIRIAPILRPESNKPAPDDCDKEMERDATSYIENCFRERTLRIMDTANKIRDINDHSCM